MGFGITERVNGKRLPYEGEWAGTSLNLLFENKEIGLVPVYPTGMPTSSLSGGIDYSQETQFLENGPSGRAPGKAVARQVQCPDYHRKSATHRPLHYVWRLRFATLRFWL